MDVSAKIPEEDMILVGEMQMSLAKRGIKAKKREIVDAAIKIVIKDPKALEQFLLRKKKDNTRELFEKWLKADASIEGDIEEHDSIL